MLDRSSLDRASNAWPSESKRSLFKYVGEADFFHQMLGPELSRLSDRSTILEVGSGVGLLAMFLAAHGHHVIAFEPQSAGFERMRVMRDFISSNWEGDVPNVTWIDDYLHANDERLASEEVDFAIAMNVVEHVPDFDSFFSDVLSVLKPGGRFRFVCPNYSIPYEPHFQIATVFNKSATYRFQRRRILDAPRIDPQGMWDELSWPTVGRLRRCLDTLDCHYAFSRHATYAYLARSLHDPTFVARHGPLLGKSFRVAAITLPRAVRFLPYAALPIIDCTVWA